MARTPGIDVLMPSSAGDAAGLLNAAFDSGRPTIFFYPKSCLNMTERATSADVERQFVPLGRARRLRRGTDLTLVSWGGSMTACQQATGELNKVGVTVDLWDLRSLSPWDTESILESVHKTNRLVVVHEDNLTCGFGAEVVAYVAEHAKVAVQCRRVTRPDTFIPYHYGNQTEILPTMPRIITVCADLLGLDLSWHHPQNLQDGVFTIAAMGSGPSDETVELLSLSVELNDSITAGQVVAEVEASKSVSPIESPVAGRVVAIEGSVGQSLTVGSPLLRIAIETSAATTISPSQCATRIPVLRRKENSLALRSKGETHRTVPIAISNITSALGSRIVRNEDLIATWPSRSVTDIVRRTGIHARRWVASNESVLSLATAACHKLLACQGLSIHDIDLLIACTTTPDQVTPSLACRIAAQFSAASDLPDLAAIDLNAACSGYLYALSFAWDYLQQNPLARVLIVTSEVLSPLLDPSDFDTAILFGDAATASLITGAFNDQTWITLQRPLIGGKPDVEGALFVPQPGRGYLKMHGTSVFRQAVRVMHRMLLKACDATGQSIEGLQAIIPHQANQRILDAVQSATGCRVLSELRESGNTSSSSIPLTLERVSDLPQGPVGLVAFGGGMTYGAVTANVHRSRPIHSSSPAHSTSFRAG